MLPEIVSARSRYAPATRRKRKNQESITTNNDEPVTINDENNLTPETLENSTDPIASPHLITTTVQKSNNQAALSILTTTPITKINQNSIVNTKFIKLSAPNGSNIIRAQNQ